MAGSPSGLIIISHIFSVLTRRYWKRSGDIERVFIVSRSGLHSVVETAIAALRRIPVSAPFSGRIFRISLKPISGGTLQTHLGSLLGVTTSLADGVVEGMAMVSAGRVAAVAVGSKAHRSTVEPAARRSLMSSVFESPASYGRAVGSGCVKGSVDFENKIQ